MTTPSWIPPDVPLDRPNVARMYDYYLGGHHNFATDRQAADAAMAIYPDLPLVMRANRAFLRRAVQFVVKQCVTGFLDALRSVAYGDWLRAEAERRGLPVVPVHPWDTLVQRILRA